MKKEEIIKLRIIAIFLVVIGHSIIIFDHNWGIFVTNNKNVFFYLLKQFINIVQMPIFIMISGYLFVKSIRKYKNIGDLIIDKFKRIIVPFIIIALFWLIPIRWYVGYTPYVQTGYLETIQKVFLGIDSGHLWYLPTLYVIFIVGYLLNKIKNKNVVSHFIIILILWIVSIFSDKVVNIMFLPTICEYLIYFYIGFLAGKREIQPKITKTTIITFTIYIISSIIIVVYIKNNYVRNVLRSVVAILGTYSLYCLTLKIKNNFIIERIDKNSFAIYLLHSPILYIMYKYFANINPYLLVAMNITIAIIAPSIIAEILRKLKLNFIIGEKRKADKRQ